MCVAFYFYSSLLLLLFRRGCPAGSGSLPVSVSWPSALHCPPCLTHCSPGNVPNPTPGPLMSTPLINTGQPTFMQVSLSWPSALPTLCLCSTPCGPVNVIPHNSRIYPPSKLVSGYMLLFRAGQPSIYCYSGLVSHLYIISIIVCTMYYVTLKP